MALFSFWPLSRDFSLYESSPFDANADLPPSPPHLHYAGMLAICPLTVPYPRPAALYPSAPFFCIWLLVPVYFLPLMGHILLEPIALLFCAKLLVVFNTGPLLTRRFLGSLSKAVFIFIWRPHPNRQCSIHVFFTYWDHSSPLCNPRAFRHKHSAFWLPLRCPHFGFHALFFILFAKPFNFHTYHNDQFLSPCPPRSFGLSPRGFAVFSYLHGPGARHVCWVYLRPSNEALIFSHWRSGIFCTVDARGRAA